MTREREPPERRGRSVVRLTHPCGSTRTVEHRSRRQQILLVTGVGAAGVTAALSAAFGPFGLAAGAMASLALLYRIWRHGRGSRSSSTTTA